MVGAVRERPFQNPSLAPEARTYMPSKEPNEH